MNVFVPLLVIACLSYYPLAFFIFYRLIPAVFFLWLLQMVAKDLISRFKK